MDFIVVDLDQTWKAFQQPQNTYSANYTPQLSTHKLLKLAQTGCTLTPDECWTTGKKPPEPCTTFTFSGGKIGGDILGSSGIGEGAQTDPVEAEGDTEGESEEANNCIKEQGSERIKDTEARRIAQVIRGKNIKLEHGSILIDVGNGLIIALPPITGQSGAILTQQFIAQINNSGYEYGQIVGMVHSHPPSTEPDPSLASVSDSRNRAPSHSLTENAGDFAVAALFRDIAGIQGADTAAWTKRYTHYIIGPHGVLREYDGADPPKSIAETNTISEQDVQDAEKDAKGQCQNSQ